MNDWKKCPSVTPGGKPFFYRKGNAVLMWDRMNGGWRITEGDKKSALFTTAKAAMKVHKIQNGG